MFVKVCDFLPYISFSLEVEPVTWKLRRVNMFWIMCNIEMLLIWLSIV